MVNLIWRNLATMPGALEWTWSTVRPLYLGDAPLHAEAIRQTIALPDSPGFSTGTWLPPAWTRPNARWIRDVLDSYQHTNALALVVLSALLAHSQPRPADPVTAAAAAAAKQFRRKNCRTAAGSMRSIPKWRRWSSELNSFGEESEPQLIASM